MTLRRYRIFLAGLALLLPGATASGRGDTPFKPGTGLAFGSFDMTDSDLAVTHVVVRRFKPIKIYSSIGAERHTVTYNNGDFYSANLSPGLYAVTGFLSGQKYFALGKRLEDVSFRIEPGQLVYAGSFKLRLTKGGFLQRDKGSFERVDAPQTESALLQMLARDLVGSPWAAAANARLSNR